MSGGTPFYKLTATPPRTIIRHPPSAVRGPPSTVRGPPSALIFKRA
jgi:hypothetical protein